MYGRKLTEKTFVKKVDEKQATNIISLKRKRELHMAEL